MFTDTAIAADTPDECLDYAGRRVTVSTVDEEILWEGATHNDMGEIRIPALGCEVFFSTDPLPVVEQIEVTIDGLPTHTFDFQDALDNHHGIVSWDPVCLDSPKPCQFDKGNYIE